MVDTLLEELGSLTSENDIRFVEQASSRSGSGTRSAALHPMSVLSHEHLFVSNHIELKGAGPRPWASGTD